MSYVGFFKTEFFYQFFLGTRLLVVFQAAHFSEFVDVAAIVMVTGTFSLQ